MKEIKNKRYKDMKKLLMILMAVALVALPTMAQSFSSQTPMNTVFQSTSTMTPTGSQYSSNPMINSDGTAYNPAEASSTSGPHKAKQGSLPGMPDTSGQGNTPIGDALIPLMLCAGAYLIIRARRRMVRSKVSEKGMEK